MIDDQLQQFYQAVGERVHIYRRRRKMSQGELALLIGSSRTTIANIELGSKGVRLYTLYLIADALGVAVADLVSQEDTP